MALPFTVSWHTEELSASSLLLQASGGAVPPSGPPDVAGQPNSATDIATTHTAATDDSPRRHFFPAHEHSWRHSWLYWMTGVVVGQP